MSLRYRRGLAAALVIALAATLVALSGGHATLARAASARATQPQSCTGDYPATRDSANPLMISPAPPASNPIQGANLWVAGPTHGVIAGAIVHLLGVDTNQQLNTGVGLAGFGAEESYAQFLDWVNARLPQASAHVQSEVKELEKSASQPAAIRISASSGGGTPSALSGQINKFFCLLEPQDPGSVLQLSTYFLKPTLGYCPTASQINGYASKFKAQINAVAGAIGRRPIVIYAEEDSVGVSKCIQQKGGIGAWESLLKYEVTTFESLPHTVVYMEGGYSDSQDARYAASVLNPAGISHAQGFFTNDTHFRWDTQELAYAESISKLTHGAHFVINTADNGRGPLAQSNTVSNGSEVLCNPPNRGLGIQPTTDPSLPSKFAKYPLDGFLWTYSPGFSVGTCNGGPPNGQYWTALGVSLGTHANNQLGPGYPSKAY